MTIQDEVKTYKTIAITLGAVGVLTFAASWIEFARIHGTAIIEGPNAWGQFGDFIGGFVGTVVSVATLIALAVTVHLQAVALRAARSTHN